MGSRMASHIKFSGFLANGPYSLDLKFKCFMLNQFCDKCQLYVDLFQTFYPVTGKEILKDQDQVDVQPRQPIIFLRQKNIKKKMRKGT